MKRQLTFVACIVLMGCGQGESSGGNGSAETAETGETTPATGATTAAAPTPGSEMRPGEWEMTTEILEMNVPGVPAGMMPKQAMETRSFKTCMKQQKPDASFFQGERSGNCTYSGFTMEKGRVQGTATCSNDGQTSTMTMDGRYASESYEMNMAMKNEQVSMKMRTSGKRIGDCAS